MSYNNWEGYNFNPNMNKKEIVQAIRNELKQEFPDITFSVTSPGGYYSDDINISIMSYKRRLATEDYLSVGYGRNFKESLHYRDRKVSDEGRNIITRVIEIGNSYNYDYSDVMRDYFDKGYILTVKIGKENKPFVIKK